MIAVKALLGGRSSPTSGDDPSPDAAPEAAVQVVNESLCARVPAVSCSWLSTRSVRNCWVSPVTTRPETTRPSAASPVITMTRETRSGKWDRKTPG
jgi:hypothetical protein